MTKFTFSILLLVLIQEMRTTDVSREEFLKNLPESNAIDDFDSCRERNDLYCHMEYKLTPLEKYESLWKNLIEEQSSERFKHIREIVKRAKCIPRSLQYNETEKYKYMENVFVDNEVNANFITAEMTFFRCQEEYYFPLNFYDKFVILCLVLYLFHVTFATIMDYLFTSIRENDQRYIYYFSVIYNYKNMFLEIKNPDYQKLKCIQGLRSAMSLVIVCSHWGLAYIHAYYDGNDYKNHCTEYKVLLTTIEFVALYAVQFFFLVSAWLATIQTLKLLSHNKNCLTLKNIIEKLKARAYRLLPCLIVLVMLASSNFALNLFPGPICDFLYVTNVNCRKNFWATLLFINNEVRSNDICLLQTWYLAADFQLYAMTLLIIYFLNKYGINIFKLITILIIVILWNSSLIYQKNLPHRFVQNENLGFRHLSGKNLYHTHLSTMSSLPSTIIGIIFGMIYNFYNKHQIKNNVKNNVILLCLSALPFGAFLIMGYPAKYDRFTSAIVGCLLKPLYSLSFAIATLGMSFNLGGPIKKLFECKFLETLSHSSYVFYLYHFIFIYSMGNTDLLYSKPFVLQAIFLTVILYALSFWLAIVLEKPWEHVVKDYLSSPKKTKKI